MAPYGARWMYSFLDTSDASGWSASRALCPGPGVTRVFLRIRCRTPAEKLGGWA